MEEQDGTTCSRLVLNLSTTLSRIVAREFRYLLIADELRRRIAAGEIAARSAAPLRVRARRPPPGQPGDRPQARSPSSRRTGMVDSRQGFGWYVVNAPLRQSLRDLTTIQRQILRGRDGRPGANCCGSHSSRRRRRSSRCSDGHRPGDRSSRSGGRAALRDRDRVGAERTSRPASRRERSRSGRSRSSSASSSEAPRRRSPPSAPRSGRRVAPGAQGAPLLRIERTTSNVGGTAVLRSVALYNPLLAELVAHLPPVPEDGAPGLRLITGQST